MQHRKSTVHGKLKNPRIFNALSITTPASLLQCGLQGDNFLSTKYFVKNLPQTALILMPPI